MRMDNYVRKAKVVRVVDGDTIDVLVDLGFDITIKERVRLARINAPEMTGAEKTKGALAKAFLVKLLEGREFVIVQTVKDKEKYGRYLAEVTFIDEALSVGGIEKVVNLSDSMLAEGYAVPYKG